MREMWLIAKGETDDEYEAVALAESEEKAVSVANLLSADDPPGSWPDYYYVSRVLRVYEDDDPPPVRVATWEAVIEGPGARPLAWAVKHWDWYEPNPSARRLGRAEHSAWRASDYPTEEAALKAVQELRAADDEEKQ